MKALANNGSLKIDESFDQALTATGREEILLLGRRFYGRFTNFFKRLALDRKYYYVSFNESLVTYMVSKKMK